MSVRTLASRPIRAVLAVATIGAGTALVLVTAAVSAGAREQVTERIEQIGTNLLVVRPGTVTPTVMRPTIRGSVTTLTVVDGDAIRRAEGVHLAAAVSERVMRARSATAATTATVMGTEGPFARIRNVTVTSGRFVDETDNEASARVAVLGARVAGVLFGDRPAIGETVLLGKVPFEVIGLLRQKGQSADGSDQDGQVLVPVRTMMRRLNNITWVSEIFVRVYREDAMERTSRAVAAVLETRHGTIDFEVQNTASLLARQNRTSDSLDLITRGVAAVTVAIRAGGIVALMLLSTTERTSEIGLRMAVGGRRLDIVQQFILEAGLLSLAGWTIGLLASGAAAVVLAAATSWHVALPLAAAGWSLPAALVIGPLAGVAPAIRASRLSPMRALLSR
jgi:ABC-type antimicrobial peptide transport system permease subunit